MHIIKVMVKLIKFTSGLLLTLKVTTNHLKKTWGQMYKELVLGHNAPMQMLIHQTCEGLKCFVNVIFFVKNGAWIWKVFSFNYKVLITSLLQDSLVHMYWIMQLL
jgi:hypothetical protein